jgi:hypothetical protein
MNHRSESTEGELHIAKECSEYTGLAGSFCTITSSNVDAIPVGAKVVYSAAAGEKGIDSDISIEPVEGDSVKGHVVLDMVSNTGTVTLTGGTGSTSGLHAETVVTFDGTEWHWDGTYHIESAPAEATS